MKLLMRIPISMRLTGCGVMAAAFMLTPVLAGDSPATSSTTKGAGASRLSGNDVDTSSSDTLSSTGTTPGSVDASSFIKEAAEGNEAEVALAEVAQRKAGSSDVKQLAEMLRNDHTQANQQLQPIAQAHNVTINQSLDSKHQKKLEQFQAMSGSQFDKEYVTDMLRDHVKDISKYEKASQQIQDNDLKQYVQQTLPKLRQHLQHVKQTAQAVGIDQATISSLSKESSDAMGGSSDSMEKSSGSSSQKPGQNDKP